MVFSTNFAPPGTFNGIVLLSLHCYTTTLIIRTTPFLLLLLTWRFATHTRLRQ